TDHCDNPVHSDVTHQDHNDGCTNHGDHNDTTTNHIDHNDHGDYTDGYFPHGDFSNPHSDAAHSDTHSDTHSDVHSDHTDAPHADFPIFIKNV
ncbi:MAG: hypothetical protein N3A54_00930, partial [Patescibacteria group bacterium]|nr:hypothetical protein [Patescibacteria group bacterium]